MDIKCNACNKKIPNGSCSMSYMHESTNDETTNKMVKKSLGKYKLNKKYEICIECFLKAFKVKP